MNSNYRVKGLSLKGKCTKLNNYGVEGLYLNGKTCEVQNYREDGYDLKLSGGLLALLMSRREGKHGSSTMAQAITLLLGF